MAKSSGVKETFKGRGKISMKGEEATKPNFDQAIRPNRTRPVGAGPGHRGDRRDTNPSFTRNRRVQANHTNPSSGRGHGHAKGRK